MLKKIVRLIILLMQSPGTSPQPSPTYPHALPPELPDNLHKGAKDALYNSIGVKVSKVAIFRQKLEFLSF